ncbi:hypothetical protein CWB41_12240 [Methylovirgula ligni]|uniref:Outer membrane beta-barrel porin/alpha-amylase n=1 Tax=Methylovirgula ligni TaxID=569860 RepID=A0A3D9YUM6_9HYPH|nr:hypothetical protein [Methylovirgula ligni]QAY96405.1 hypothetical protein CWB41_12240 [Methylovirgula ligni]REF85868.1 hypothetical protein DES32_1906 [Methylovirgula ligni]
MIHRGLISIFFIVSLGATSVRAQEATSADNGANTANNPLTPEVTLNLQDYFVPTMSGIRGSSNQFLLRGLVPEKIGGVPQLLRFTVPVATAPPLPTGSETAVGDVTLTDFFVLPGKVTFAGGPLLVLPSGTALSQGRWQTGAAGAAVAPQSWGVLGALAIYQHSFAAALGHDDVSLLTFQPIVTYNLAQGFYIRSSGIWTFDLVHNLSYVPIGLGLGQVVQFGKTTMNYFIEPQYSVAREGTGAPRWQIFGGVNFQFAMH